ncbi:hypothetical protein J3R82DRAFT_2542 [Butyriboletus roseoflavus]|nr:hypothetical protein J3R82DRAFT_2542 [Butyriboletus roseoflavus]
MSDHASSPSPVSVPTTQQKPDTEVRVKEEESLTLPSPTTSVAQSEVNPDAPSSSPSRSTRRTPAQRRAVFRNDPQAQEVEPRRVLCRACQKWIKLSGISDYSLANWQSHKHRCCGSTPAPQSVRRTPSKPNFSPSSRVATAERKIVLLNDPQVKACSAGHVQCGTCKSVVALEGEVDYELTKWTEHKGKCIPMTPTPITPQGSTSSRPRVFPPPSTSSTHSQVSAGRSARSPTPVGENSSNNSTETTAVTESSPAAVKVGVKRSREEETEDEAEVAKDERPTSRPRTETYRPPEKEAPNLFGWFMQPLKEFARGFRQGLGST